MVSYTCYPNLPIFLHRYICHIYDISQLWLHFLKPLSVHHRHHRNTWICDKDKYFSTAGPKGGPKLEGFCANISGCSGHAEIQSEERGGGGDIGAQRYCQPWQGIVHMTVSRDNWIVVQNKDLCMQVTEKALSLLNQRDQLRTVWLGRDGNCKILNRVWNYVLLISHCPHPESQLTLE